jgi:hypothetical protein
MYSTGVEIVGNACSSEPRAQRLRHRAQGDRSVHRRGQPDRRATAPASTSTARPSPQEPGEFTPQHARVQRRRLHVPPLGRGNELVGNNFIDNIDQVAWRDAALEANRSGRASAATSGATTRATTRTATASATSSRVADAVREHDDKEPKLRNLRLFLFSPAQQAIEFVGRAVPAVRPEAKFTDEVPLMRKTTLIRCVLGLLRFSGRVSASAASTWRPTASGPAC